MVVFKSRKDKATECFYAVASVKSVAPAGGRLLDVVVEKVSIRSLTDKRVTFVPSARSCGDRKIRAHVPRAAIGLPTTLTNPMLTEIVVCLVEFVTPDLTKQDVADKVLRALAEIVESRYERLKKFHELCKASSRAKTLYEIFADEKVSGRERCSL